MEHRQVIVPREIFQAGKFELGIRWQDGHESIYPCDRLRKLCRCASCVDEVTGARRLDESQVPENVHPEAIDSVGRYGIQINWSDGHKTGIYDYAYLRKICPCMECHEPSSKG